MKTLLVLADHPATPEMIQAALSPADYRIIHRTSVEDAEPMLVRGLADFCILDLNLDQVDGLWVLEQVHRRAPRLPTIVFTDSPGGDFEEQAYRLGVDHVLVKPVRPRLLETLLGRLLTAAATPSARPSAPAPTPAPAPASFQTEFLTKPTGDTGFFHAFGPLRSFSGILTHSLNAEAMLQQFLLQLRELLSVNRAAVFLMPPGDVPARGEEAARGRRMTLAGSMGLSPDLRDTLELSAETGIGGQVRRLGRILRRDSAAVQADPETEAEFERLGAQVAVPVLDRETVLGVAVFDCRITGEPLGNSELTLLFHLLEQLGLAIRNTWLHNQLAANHEMLAGVLCELSSICVVVSRDLAVLHANKMARKHFLQGDRRGGDFDFADVPKELGAKIYQVLKTGAAVANFRFSPTDDPETIYSVNVIPFQKQPGGLPASVLLTADDLSQTEQLQKLEVEAANLRLIRNMAERVATEVGNAMMPVSTYQQMKDANSRASLEPAMADSVRRVMRTLIQMRYLATDKLAQEPVTLGPLIEEAFHEACKQQPVKAPKLTCENANPKAVVTGDRAALKHALAEIMINALQANPKEPKVAVHITVLPGSGASRLQVDIEDQGEGFDAEAVKKAMDPFFTTRVVGLGLGLTVSRKILESHQGRIEILPAKSGHPTTVRVSLPLQG